MLSGGLRDLIYMKRNHAENNKTGGTMKTYNFYGWEKTTIPAITDEYPSIRTPQEIQDKETLRRLSKAKKAGAAFAADAGAAIVVAADSEKADTWIEDSSIALTYMMLAAEEQDLGCCWVQMHMRTSENGRDAEENVREILGFQERFRIVGLLAIGRKEDQN